MKTVHGANVGSVNFTATSLQQGN